MTQVLYRKYRPQIFKEIIGQEYIVRTLQNSLASGNIAHAYLFTGPRGTGKTTVARILAKTLNCTSPKDKREACLKCNSCVEMRLASSLDLIEIDAASNRGIDEIRQLKEGVRYASTRGKYKVYLIDEVHMLTKEAFNALLKTLEEPPEHVVFILATTESHKVLPTIISRCQRFDFRYLTYDEIEGRLKNILKKENKTLDAESVRVIISASGGSMRDAESILGKILSLGTCTPAEIREMLGITDFQKLASFIDLITNSDSDGAIKHINTVIKEGGDLGQFTNNLINYTRILLLIKLSPSSSDIVTANFTSEEQDTVKKQSSILTEKDIYNIIKEFIDASISIKYSPVPQLPLELAVVSLIDAKSS